MRAVGRSVETELHLRAFREGAKRKEAETLMHGAGKYAAKKRQQLVLSVAFNVVAGLGAVAALFLAARGHA